MPANLIYNAMDLPTLPQPPGLVLAPFKAVRYAAGRVLDLAAVTSPPYDLIDRDTAKRLMAAHPHNIVRLILPQDAGERHRLAAQTLRRWLAEGVLVPDRQPALYVYEELAGSSRQRGLIGNLGLARPQARIVLPHEDVLPGPVADRLGLMEATQANLEPIFCLYEGGGPATALVDNVADTRSPLIDVATNDGLRHRVWAVTDPVELAVVSKDLRSRQALIADGHHRYATYLSLQARRHQAGHGRGPWDFGLALLVDSTAYPPRLGAIHRVVPGLAGEEAIARASAVFQTHELPPVLPHALARLRDWAKKGPAFLLVDERGFRLLTDPDPRALDQAMPADRSPRWRRLAASVVQELLIKRLWGISEDERSVQVVHHDAEAAVRLARRSRGVAIIMNPLDVADVLTIAAAGERVPRKSTSFSPKPRTGLLLRSFAVS